MNDQTNRAINKLLSSIGLARKAGKVLLGADVVCDAAKGGKVKLILVSEGASENTKRRIRECSETAKVKMTVVEAETEALGAAVGKRPLACVGITDENFVKLIERNICKSR